MATLSMSTAGCYTVGMFNDPECIAGFMPRWHQLLKDVTTAPAFASPLWYRAALATHSDGEIRLFVVYRRGVPVGFLPLVKRQTTLGFASDLSDYNDMILDRSEPGAAKALCKALMEQREGTLLLSGFKRDAHLLNAFKSEPRALFIDGLSTCRFVALHGGYDHYLAGRSANFRSALRRCRNKAARVGLHLSERSPQDLAPHQITDLFLQCHLVRNPRGVLAGDRPAAFLRTTLPDLFKTGLLRVFTLSHQTETVAIQLSFQADNGLLYWNGGHKEKAAPYSPGRLLFDYQIQICVREGLAYFDLLRGNETYKRAWATGEKQLITVVVPLKLPLAHGDALGR